MNLGNRNSQHSFAQIPSVNHARSVFDRSFGVKDTFDGGYLIPCFVDEILPGDTCNVNVNAFIRLATQIVPIMDNIYLDFHFFFVPNRLLWTNWERFNGAQDDPGDTTDYQVPYLVYTNAGTVDNLYDKMGLPINVSAPGVEVNSLPFRAYYKIYNDWYRDQNVTDSVVLPLDDGPDVLGDFSLRPRAKQHDYFSSCLPWPQKGTAIDLPLGTTAPVVTTGSVIKWSTASDTNFELNTENTTNRTLLNITGAATAPFKFGSTTGLEADLSSATAATINQLREAFQVQSLLELDARGGTRYVEILLSHFGVVSPDFRLQRAEFLGGGTVTIQSHIVPQTSPTSGSNPQAQLAAYGTGSTIGRKIGFTKSFVEHGYVIGIVSARPEISYQQGLNRMWSRSTRYDFFWPKLQEIGEQAVLTKELYCTGSAAVDEDVFGYQERYSEMKYKPSEIHGKFRSDYATPIDQWHLAQEFGSQPLLNDTFINWGTATTFDRVIALPNEPHFLMDVFFDYKHTRPMAVYSTPLSLGRF